MSITPKPRGNIVNYYTGSSNIQYIKNTGSWISLMISNDGLSSLTVNVNNIVYTINAGEVFDEDFEDFTDVDITTTVNYRLWLRE
jgi:hypothetical protein